MTTTERSTAAREPVPDHEQKRVALGYLQEAWAEASLDGIDGDCLAQACLFTAFAEFVTTYGEAMDSGDKATNKAMSAAYKYAAMQAFCIPTEGDNDADATTHEVAAEPRDDVADRLAKALAEHGGSVRAIKAYLATGDLSMAAEAWAEIGEDGQRALWVAPSKGGPFTTDERNTMKSPDFTAALRNLKEHA